jgi:hypothetical protein
MGRLVRLSQSEAAALGRRFGRLFPAGAAVADPCIEGSEYRAAERRADDVSLVPLGNVLKLMMRG